MVKVLITQSRVGPNVSYKAGQEALLSPEKAAWAEEHGWAKILETTPRKIAPPPTSKVVEPTPERLTKVSAAAILARFAGDPKALRAFAKENNIKVAGRLKDAEAIAKIIAENL